MKAVADPIWMRCNQQNWNTIHSSVIRQHTRPENKVNITHQKRHARTRAYIHAPKHARSLARMYTCTHAHTWHNFIRQKTNTNRIRCSYDNYIIYTIILFKYVNLSQFAKSRSQFMLDSLANKLSMSSSNCCVSTSCPLFVLDKV